MRFAWMLLGLLPLAGCAEYDLAPPAAFGEAVRHNMAAQIIDPEPDRLSLGAAPGVRRAIAVGRYQTDQVEPPAEETTIGD